MNIQKELAEFFVLGFFAVISNMTQDPFPFVSHPIRIEAKQEKVSASKTISPHMRGALNLCGPGTPCLYRLLKESAHGIPDSVERSRRNMI